MVVTDDENFQSIARNETISILTMIKVDFLRNSQNIYITS